MNEQFQKLRQVKPLLWFVTAVLALPPLACRQEGFDKATKTAQIEHELPAKNSTDTLAFSPDGRLLAGGHGLAGAELRIWDLKNKQLLHEFRTGHNGGIGLVAFSPTGKIVVTSGRHDDEDLLLWDVQTGKSLGKLAGAQWIQNSLTFSPDGRYLVNAGHNEHAIVEIWDVATRRSIRVLKESKGDVFAAIGPDGRTILTAGTDGAKTWDLNTGKLLHKWPLKKKSAAEGYVNVTAAISPDGKILAFGKSYKDGTRETIELWGVSSGRLLHTLLTGRGSPYTIALQDITFSPDGKILANSSMGEGKGVTLWDVQTGVVRNSLKGNGNALAFSPDGKLLALGSVRKVRLWNISEVG